MSNILTGLGRPSFITPGTAATAKHFPIEPLEFSIEANSTKLQAKKYVNGVKTVAATRIGEVLYTLKLGIEAISWAAMQFALGEVAGTTASIALPEIRYATVPTSSPYEITDTDIGDSAGVWVNVLDSGTWGADDQLTFQGTSGPAAGSFYVDSGADKLVFNAAQAGAPISYRILKTHTNLASIGQEQVVTLLDNMAFDGITYSDKEYYKIRIPRLLRASAPSLNLADVTKLEVEFDLATPSGLRKPFQIFKMPSNYQP